VDVEKALEALTPKARRIMELREYGYLYREIAQMLDTTEAAVKMQVKRAFETMKEALSALLILLWFFGL
jgi:RNA polymerase sigma-70 factor (ECF subfamily)